MSGARVFVHRVHAADFLKIDAAPRRKFQVAYLSIYAGPPISLTMPVRSEPYDFDRFPPFFDGLLPEGVQLDGLLRQAKIDRLDYFEQLLSVGSDLVGAVTVVRIIDS